MNQNTFVVALLVCLAFASRTAGAAPQVGDAAPELGLEQLLQAPRGADTNWEELRGKVVVLEFWATWCAPCIAAIPHLNELSDHFKGKPVQFIAITDEQTTVIESFLKKRAIRAWVGLDTNRSIFKAYNVGGIPHTVIVNTNGMIEGITYPLSLKAEHIENLLAGKPAGFARPSPNDRQVPANAPPSEGKPPLFQVVIRPSDETSTRMSAGPAGKTEFGPAFEYKMYGSTLAGALPAIFGVTSARLIVNATMPTGHFDFIVRVPQKESDRVKPLLQEGLCSSFRLVSRREQRDADIYLLKVKEPGHKGLQETASTGGMSASSGPGRINAINGKMSSLAHSLESVLKIPVQNDTELKAAYDYELTWKQKNGEAADPEILTPALREQLGLDLQPAKQSLEFIILEAEQTVADKK